MRKDEKWIEWATAGAQFFSTCGKRKYMAVIIDQHGHVVGIGYNGSPSGYAHCEDGGCPRFLNNTPSGSSYNDCISVHAEVNALLHSDWSARQHGVTMYVNGTPCWDCTKVIANSGVKRLVAIRDESYPNLEKSVSFLEECGVEVTLIPQPRPTPQPSTQDG